MWLHDVFISHASEDKDTFVRSLAERLRTEHVEVWYDEFALRVGDSLRASIDRGLSRSRFGIVVLSQAFFSKRWPERELNGLVARELAGLDRVILPIWHGVTRDEVIEFSPPLADVLASNSALGIDAVVRDVLAVVRPRGSPLVVARDELAKQGLRPPVITDEYWLDVVEASNRESGEGFALQREHWGRWSFPLPPESRDPVGRGRRLAVVAMQLAWTEAADAQCISQITPPEGVLSFVESQPGLAAACHQSPAHLAVYAPQLTIPAFSGTFAEDFDSALRDSHTANERRGEPALRNRAYSRRHHAFL